MMCVSSRPREVLYTARNDDELAGLDEEFAFAAILTHPHAQRAFDDIEQLVLSIVMVPDELALQLDQLDVGVVDLAYDLWAVVIGEQRQFLREIDFSQHSYRVVQTFRSASSGTYKKWRGVRSLQERTPRLTAKTPTYAALKRRTTQTRCSIIRKSARAGLDVGPQALGLADGLLQLLVQQISQRQETDQR